MKSEYKNGILTAFLEGHIDSANSMEIEKKIDKLIADHQPKSLTLDALSLEYISSAGLRVVLKLRKRVGRSEGKFALASLKPEILSVFKISGLTSVLKIFDTPEGALASFDAG